jgi:hypothetical protein
MKLSSFDTPEREVEPLKIFPSTTEHGYEICAAFESRV